MNLHNAFHHLRFIMELTGWFCWSVTTMLFLFVIAAAALVSPVPCTCGQPWECDHV